jgi:hypothetical protein
VATAAAAAAAAAATLFHDSHLIDSLRSLTEREGERERERERERETSISLLDRSSSDYSNVGLDRSTY